MRRVRIAAIVLAVAWSWACAWGQERLPEYRAERQVTGTIRSWGSAQMQELMQRWETGFHKYQPQVKFENKLNGVVSAMGGLYSHAADLALMGREIWPMESMAFQQMTGYRATGVEVATGSFDVPTKADALVIFVHKGNPISHLTLQQLDAIFGAEHRRGTKNFRTWGDLGLTGEWAHHPIDLYGARLDSAVAIFFRNVVMKGSLQWHGGIHEYANRPKPGGGRIDWGKQILDALAKDRYGIAISNPYYAGPEVKAVALGEHAHGPFVAATRESVQDRSYPLARAVYIFYRHASGKEINPAQEEFLKYVLSRQGQDNVKQEGAYLPLPVKTVERERRKLSHVIAQQRGANVEHLGKSFEFQVSSKE